MPGRTFRLICNSLRAVGLLDIQKLFVSVLQGPQGPPGRMGATGANGAQVSNSFFSCGFV
jgi:hypothetical protein